MLRKIVLAGGSGFLGQHIQKHFEKQGVAVYNISRSGDLRWEDTKALCAVLEGAEMLINLAGRSVDCRYTAKNKAEIFNSRVDTTHRLGELLALCKEPPLLWLNSSTATIYRHAEDRPMSEADGEMGEGFSVEVAKAWEKSFFEAEINSNIRRVALRISIVLGSDGGAFPVIARLARLGLGGKQGSGKQMFSWIHIEDLLRCIDFVAAAKSIAGAVNCASPNALSNAEFMQELRSYLGRSWGLAAPKWLLEIGAVFLRTETELVLKSRWVFPQILLGAGFEFLYPDMQACLKAL